MEVLQVGKVRLPGNHRLFPLLEDMREKRDSVVTMTCEGGFLVDIFWVLRDTAHDDAAEPYVQRMMALASLFDGDVAFFGGWRDVIYLVIDWDGMGDPPTT